MTESELSMVAFGVGLILLVLAFLAFRKTRAFIARCHTTEATITGYREEPDSDSGVLFYFSDIEFKDASGASHRVGGPHGLQEPRKIGSRVSITYDPQSPSNAWITGTAPPWVIPWLMLIAGLVAIGTGVAVRMSGGSR